MLHQVAERRQAAHEHGGRRVAAVADALGAEHPAKGSGNRCGKPVRSPECRAWSPRRPSPARSACTPRRNCSGCASMNPAHCARVNTPAVEADQRGPLGPAARPTKWFGRLLASAQVGDGSARRRVELLLQDIHAKNGEEPLARKSTLGKRPNVSRSLRTSQKVSGPSDTAASGVSKRPRILRSTASLWVSTDSRNTGTLRIEDVQKSAGAGSCEQAQETNRREHLARGPTHTSVRERVRQASLVVESRGRTQGRLRRQRESGEPGCRGFRRDSSRHPKPIVRIRHAR